MSSQKSTHTFKFHISGMCHVEKCRFISQDRAKEKQHILKYQAYKDDRQKDPGNKACHL